MACFKPLEAWHSKEINESGKRSMVFNPNQALQRDNPIKLPCGQCIGCRLERSRQWAIRCVHEASLYENNCFLTLTFSPEELEKRKNPDSLDVRDFQLFMKRLRKKYGNNIRFFHCGEYGETYGRPHYHAIIFNHDFDDKELISITNGYRLYKSDSLSALWPFGFASIGSVTFESAAYVARYVMKKVTGDESEHHYSIIDTDTGEVIGQKKPEYTTMSRRPGIGTAWFEKYKTDVYPSDFITVNGVKMKPPKFYDKLLEKLDLDEISLLKEQRMENAYNFQDDNTYDRLQVREALQQIKLNQLPRNVDKEN